MKTHRLILAALLLAVRVSAGDLSRAVIDLSVDAGLPVLTFDLTSGTAYRIDERTNLLSGAWTEIGDAYSQSGADTYVLPPGESTVRFFRLRYDDDVDESEPGADTDTFDIAILSNRIQAVQAALWNEGDGGIVILTNYLADAYTLETHMETTSEAEITSRLEAQEGTNSVFLHLTPDTVVVFTNAASASHAEGLASQGERLIPLASGSGTPGGIGLDFRNGRGYRDGDNSPLTISVRGNVVTAGDYQFDFGTPPFGWDPPSIGERIRELWQQGPPPFKRYPPSPCGDAMAIYNSRVFSVLRTKFTLYANFSVDEAYQFLFDYSYEYICPNGPLRKVMVVFFQYYYIIRDQNGNVTDRKVQNAYYVWSQLQ